ncbi:MAG: hypothetical protein WD342_04535 [Verrucomicrobiales bacterium]
MRTSVCIFSREHPAKLVQRNLEERHVGSSLVVQPATLGNYERVVLYVIAAERPEHPIILDEVTNMETADPALLRCARCGSPRLEIPLDEQYPKYVRACRSFLSLCGLAPFAGPPLIVCRDCRNVTPPDSLTETSAPPRKVPAGAVAA